ncbi:type II secretion system protein F (GspF) [Pseudidiomarina planktonica]|uniref:General secretion pathway protein F n=1 Tax=Pseudidiomarina planktonica TaxID=1323738 RepID=A0A1Y6EG67_9GAMM|nr:type II secretion system inner membrane protein GspF [Pseudidiomarina planktonica]RUO65950.1 type II secretion system protein GspF [Pseudidiomarina planktonica]SMQ61587.1 type II secretion system protein F (GspF) [Pseudidiomarina planktonica]
MAAFEYQAVTAKGSKKKGIIEADTVRQVRQQLREQGLMPIRVDLAAEQDRGTAEEHRARLGWLSSGSFRSGVSASDLALVTRQLSTLVGSALPIEQALLAVADQSEKPRLQKLIMAVRSKVVEGYSLAESMAEYPRVFDNLYTAMVGAGERSGHLDEVLSRLADYTEQRQHMKSQLVQALVYPAMLTLVAVGIIVFLLVSVVPQIVEQFTTLGQELPPTTTALIAISETLRGYGIYLLLLIGVALIVFKQALRKPAFRDKFHAWLLRMPLFGKVIRGVNTARFSRTLSILSASAVPLLEGLRITATVLSNRAMHMAVSDAADRVREGSSLRAALAQTKLFPPMMLHMISAGEKSGELEQMLGRAADNQDREFENLVSISLKIFEPVLIVTMAGIVLFIVLAIIQPILQLNQSIGL